MPREQVPLIRAAEDFETFFRREYRPVLGLALVLCGNRPVAEELTQDAFLAALRQWDRVGVYDRPEAWVRRVVANHSVSRFRRRMSETRMILKLGHSHPAPPIVDVADTVDIWAEVRRLPRRQAQVVALTYLHDLSRRQVAEVLGCGEETVKTHLDRARATLAERLDHPGGGPS